MKREIDIVYTNKEPVIAYGYHVDRKVYKITKLEDGYMVQHKDPNTHARNLSKRYPNRGWHFNTVLITHHAEMAAHFVLNDLA